MRKKTETKVIKLKKQKRSNKNKAYLKLKDMEEDMKHIIEKIETNVTEANKKE